MMRKLYGDIVQPINRFKYSSCTVNRQLQTTVPYLAHYVKKWINAAKSTVLFYSTGTIHCASVSGKNRAPYCSLVF